MTTHASIEQMERRWIAFVPGLLGCFASSEDRELAIKNLPAAIRAYLDWVDQICIYWKFAINQKNHCFLIIQK